MQNHFNGGSSGNGAKVLSIYHFTMEYGQLLDTLSPGPQIPQSSHLHGQLHSISLERKSCLWEKDGSRLRAGSKLWDGTTSHKARLESLPVTGWGPVWGMPQSACLLAKGCPQGSVLRGARPWEVGDVCLHQRAHSKLHCLHHQPWSCQTGSSYYPVWIP